MGNLGYNILSVLAVILLVGIFTTTGAEAATVQINNLDGAGEGFNDPTPAAPVGGNPGTTLGAQRLAAFQYAADLIGARLHSNVTIVVDAQMNPLTCTPTAAVLGAAGTNSVHGNFTNAPVFNTWYPQALANSLAGADLSPSLSDISAQFNSNLDLGCYTGGSWYYGFDMDPGTDLDFVTVVLHELCHGLGFQTFVNLGSGAKLGGYNDGFMLNIRHNGHLPAAYASMTDGQRVTCSQGDPDLVWAGSGVTSEWPMIPLTGGTTAGFARLHGPSPQQPGSSVSHWSTALTPNETMEPLYTGPIHTVGLALDLFEDIGWQLEPGSEVSVTITSFQTRVTTDGVEISATFASQSGATGVNVYRADGGQSAPFLLIEALGHDSSSDFAYTDTTVAVGQTYGYRIGVTDGSGEYYSQINQVSVPGLSASLDQNVPNPFNPITTIRYVIPSQQEVRLSVYDVTGAPVRNLVDGVQTPGEYEAVWDGTNDNGRRVGTGVYFYRLQSGSFIQSRKMVLLK